MSKLLLSLLLLCGFHQMKAQVYRGVNINAVHFATMSSGALTMLNASGADVIRLSFGYSPLVNKTPPYAYNAASFNYLNNALNYCEAHSIKVIIDPHTTPGTASNYTMNPTDPFWIDPTYHQYLYRLWDTLSTIVRNRGDVIYGLDLMNEPSLPCCDLQLWNNMADSLTTIIRANGDNHPIIVEPFSYINGIGQYITRLNAMPELVLPDDDNLIVSPHFYNPQGFSHQGVDGRSVGQPYPGVVNGIYYDSLVLVNRMQPIVDFQNSHAGIRVLLGEFSASRAGGDDSNVYIDDLIGTFEAHGWDWAYHEFRGAAVWDAEMPLGNNDAATRDTNLARMQTLMHYFRLRENVLPIYSAILNVKALESGNELNWEIYADEIRINISIERSTDGNVFEEISAQLQSNAWNNYTGYYLDKSPINSGYFYRLKVTGTDGKVVYSNIVWASGQKNQTTIVSPTINRGELRINSSKGADHQDIIIINTVGNIVAKFDQRDIDDLSLDISFLIPGTYFVKIGTEFFKIIRI
ncbi:MAG: cellulase family glycosylhydrolase [Saprospiraceae bacterium]